MELMDLLEDLYVLGDLISNGSLDVCVIVLQGPKGLVGFLGDTGDMGAMVITVTYTIRLG